MVLLGLYSDKEGKQHILSIDLELKTKKLSFVVIEHILCLIEKKHPTKTDKFGHVMEVTVQKREILVVSFCRVAINVFEL